MVVFFWLFVIPENESHSLDQSYIINWFISLVDEKALLPTTTKTETKTEKQLWIVGWALAKRKTIDLTNPAEPANIFDKTCVKLWRK